MVFNSTVTWLSRYFLLDSGPSFNHNSLLIDKIASSFFQVSLSQDCMQQIDPTRGAHGSGYLALTLSMVAWKSQPAVLNMKRENTWVNCMILHVWWVWCELWSQHVTDTSNFSFSVWYMVPMKDRAHTKQSSHFNYYCYLYSKCTECCLCSFYTSAPAFPVWRHTHKFHWRLWGPYRGVCEPMWLLVLMWICLSRVYHTLKQGIEVECVFCTRN